MEARTIEMPGTEVWWHVYPLGAVGAPVRDPDPELASAGSEGTGDPGGAVVHRLPRLLPWIGHAASLGVTGIQLGPVFASTTHGYDTVDFERIDPRLGDESDFRRLVDTAHDAGLRVMLDGVFNHVGEEHPLYLRALAEGQGSDAARHFRIDWRDPANPRAATFEGHGSLVALDHAQPAVEDLVAATMSRWLDAGADAWRLDAAYAIDPAFWSRVLPRVRASHPRATFTGEVIHGDYAGVVERSGMDAVTQYELWKAAWSSVADRNLFELAWALDRHNVLVERFRPMTFAGNHDVTRIASRVGDAGAAVALAVVMTVGGTPSVYYGDDLGWRGIKEDRPGGDDAVRTALPGSPWDLPPSSWPSIELHRRLIGLRRRHAWLADAHIRTLELTNERMTYLASGREGEAARVTLDLSATPRSEIRIGGEELHVGG
jgi:cyclomaltodextrinase / maltogenic alpha-amylase / neopullulanase